MKIVDSCLLVTTIATKSINYFAHTYNSESDAANISSDIEVITINTVIQNAS